MVCHARTFGQTGRRRQRGRTDRAEALAVLREAVELGITHIDTSDAYGPHVTNRLIREALRPYPESLHIVTKVGATRDEDGGWPPARRPADLRRQVHDNLDTLGLDVLDLVDLRLGDAAQGSTNPRESAVVRIPPTGIPLEDVERQALTEALRMANWVQKDAADLLSISPRVMNYKIKTLKIDLPKRRVVALAG